MYNLLDEKWLPVLWADGTYNRVGIRKALAEAHRIKQIAASNPMDRLAVIRFLLALLYWCRGNPPDPVGAPAGPFPARWFSKLDENSEYFELLGDGKRFYQYRKDGDKKLSSNYLIHEVPTGTNFWHFRHATDKTNGLCPACCALGLLRLPIFSTQGGQGKSPGINARPPIYVVPVGETLAESLRIAWRPVSILGLPAWEKSNLQLPKTGEVSLLTGLTWLPRRVWLSDPQEPEASCISCGRREQLIRSSVFAGIGSAKAPNRIWRDPHVIHEQSKQGEITSLHSTNALDTPDAGSGQWTRITTGVLGNPRNDRIKAWVVGFSSDRNKYFEASESFLPWSGLPDQVAPCIEMLNQWQQSSSSLNRKLKSSDIRASSLKHPEIQSMLAAIRPHVENKVSDRLGQLLIGGDEAWQEAASKYKPMMKAVAGSLSPGYTTEALTKRLRISGTLPDMNQPSKPGKSPSKKKGGNK